MAQTTGHADGEIPKEVTSPNTAEHSEPVSLQNRDDAEKSTSAGALADKRDYPPGIKRALILGPVTLTYFLWFLDLAVVSTATPAITSQFNSLVDVGWYGTGRNLKSLLCY